MNLLVRGESHIDFRTQCVIITVGGVGGRGGLSLMMFWNSEKLWNFEAHKLSWPVNELCTRILRVLSSCPAIAHIYSQTLWKIIFLYSLAQGKKNWTKAARQRKLQISNYNLKYPVIINFTVFEHVIIPDNIQNLKFYQGSSKNMNDNMMFCTKNKLLTQKTVLKASLFQIFY